MLPLLGVVLLFLFVEAGTENQETRTAKMVGATFLGLHLLGMRKTKGNVIEGTANTYVQHWKRFPISFRN